MRGSEMVELAADVLPGPLRRAVGVVALAALLATGTADDVAWWFIEDKAAAILEDLVIPALDRLDQPPTQGG